MASSNIDLIQSILSIALGCSIVNINENYEMKEEESGSIIIYENHLNPPSMEGNLTAKFPQM